jgi:hypothetical protein
MNFNSFEYCVVALTNRINNNPSIICQDVLSKLIINTLSRILEYNHQNSIFQYYFLNISTSISNIIQSCYWIEWLIEFESICKQKKEKIKCERRSNIPKQVENKYQLDVIWLIWDIFLKKAETRPPIIKKLIKALLSLFSLKYTNGCNHKRRYILYFVVSLLCENISLNEEIMREQQKEVVTNVIKNIDSIYRQIKKNEESPGTDYLFKDVKASNLEKTIEKLEAMNNFGEKFVPRV